MSLNRLKKKSAVEFEQEFLERINIRIKQLTDEVLSEQLRLALEHDRSHTKSLSNIAGS